MIRYARPSSERVDHCAGWTCSPAITPAARTASPPSRLCQPTETSGSRGRLIRGEANEPVAHISAAPMHASGPMIVRAALRLDHSSATPAKPSSTAPRLAPVTRSPRERAQQDHPQRDRGDQQRRESRRHVALGDTDDRVGAGQHQADEAGREQLRARRPDRPQALPDGDERQQDQPDDDERRAAPRAAAASSPPSARWRGTSSPRRCRRSRGRPDRRRSGLRPEGAPRRRPRRPSCGAQALGAVGQQVDDVRGAAEGVGDLVAAGDGEAATSSSSASATSSSPAGTVRRVERGEAAQGGPVRAPGGADHDCRSELWRAAMVMSFNGAGRRCESMSVSRCIVQMKFCGPSYKLD